MKRVLFASSLLWLTACTPSDHPPQVLFRPREVVDLGALVTEDLPERFWGRALMAQMGALGFTRQNTFEVIPWELEKEGGTVAGSNAYYEFFNHGGPHVDAPRHVSVGPGLDAYPIEAFSGPVKLFDAREFPNGRSIPEELFRGLVNPGDVVLVFTGYVPPQTDDATPELATLTPAAAEYLASLPVRAFGTDAYSVDTSDPTPVVAESATARAVPIHHAFLSRMIPIYEQLLNLDRLVARPESDALFFVGVPLAIQDGDGMLVRPVVFVY
jgi:kynurenine formamidase